MTSDLDTYRTALDLPGQHSDTAPIFVAMEADKLPDAGDLDGAATWRMVLRAIRGTMEPEGVRH